MQRFGRIAADDGSKEGKWPLFTPQQQVTQPQGIYAASLVRPGSLEGVAHEVLDGGQHARDQLGILCGHLGCGYVLNEKAGFAVN